MFPILIPSPIVAVLMALVSFVIVRRSPLTASIVALTSVAAALISLVSPVTFAVTTDGLLYAAIFTLALHVTCFKLLGGSLLTAYFHLMAISMTRPASYCSMDPEIETNANIAWSLFGSFFGVLLLSSLNTDSLAFTMLVATGPAMYVLYRAALRQVPPTKPQPASSEQLNNSPAGVLI